MVYAIVILNFNIKFITTCGYNKSNRFKYFQETLLHDEVK